MHISLEFKLEINNEINRMKETILTISKKYNKDEDLVRVSFFILFPFNNK